MAPAPVLKLDKAVFAWPGTGGEAGFELRIEDWEVAPGARVALVGPSGSGKTTLLNLLSGVTVAQSGAVGLLGVDWGSLSSPARDRRRVDHVGLVFQMFNLLPYLGLAENVTLPLTFSRRRRAAVQERGGAEAEARRLLGALGLDLDRFAGRPVSELSVGQQQRVAAARALIGGPELLLADEPTSALDAVNRDAFLDLLFREADAAGAAVVAVTHDEQAAARFDQRLQLSDLITQRVAA